jgi:hypothetical protein
MRQFLRRLLWALAAGSAVFTALTAIGLHFQVGDFLTRRSFLFSLAGSLLFVWAAIRWSMRAQFRLLLACFTIATAEFVFNAAAWCGLLPGVATKEKCAFGRVYWQREGHGNSIRNRAGWHAPEFLPAASRRVAVIGDSFVEAVEVHRSDIHAVLLQSDLRRAGNDVAIYPLGTHGTSPAHHREVIEYAARHWQPQEAIVVVYLGNDLTDMIPEASGVPPASYIYYQLDAAHRPVLDPASQGARDAFDTGLEFSHRPLLAQASTILRSHCMLVQMCNSIRDQLAKRRQMAGLRSDPAREFDTAGRNLAVFDLPPSPLAQRCMDLLLAELDLCAETCRQHGMALRLVTVPAFPAEFYQTQSGREWTANLGHRDYLRPERDIAQFAAAHGWPCLALGERMRADRLDVSTIRSFYFVEGTGHFSEAGHRYCADAMRAAFFSP